MQSLIAMVAVFAFIYAIVWIKNHGHSFIVCLHDCIKRFALYVMSFSWVMVFVTVLMIAFYSDISGLLKDLLAANSIEVIKNLIRIIFGVDSAFAVLQIFALYSIIASFVSCLVLSVGIVIQIFYRAILKVSNANIIDNGNCFECCNKHPIPTSQIYLKYNS